MDPIMNAIIPVTTPVKGKKGRGRPKSSDSTKPPATKKRIIEKDNMPKEPSYEFNTIDSIPLAILYFQKSAKTEKKVGVQRNHLPVMFTQYKHVGGDTVALLSTMRDLLNIPEWSVKSVEHRTAPYTVDDYFLKDKMMYHKKPIPIVDTSYNHETFVEEGNMILHKVGKKDHDSIIIRMVITKVVPNDKIVAVECYPTGIPREPVDDKKPLKITLPKCSKVCVITTPLLLKKKTL